MNENVRLTEYSKGAGCGCKIAPSVLEEILATANSFTDLNLLVGNSARDDAAVYDLGDGNVLIATTDFFMPVVDDAFDFGRIAAANAISDIYAMGGKPLVAVAILGWPVQDLQPQLAARVLEGARHVCAQAGIAVAGGHSIESREPIFGLSVNGVAKQNSFKRNDTAREGDLLFLTKPIGTGILSTAVKRKVIEEQHLDGLIESMSCLNRAGEELGKISGVSAMTDVTGFGLAGHALEMARGSGLSVQIQYSDVQLLPGVEQYLAKRVIPDATFRNWQSYQNEIDFGSGVDVMQAFSVLPDPQTNGGLLIAVSPEDRQTVSNVLIDNGLQDHAQPIGEFIGRREKWIYVIG